VVIIAALLQGTAMSFHFSPGQSHQAARAMFHRVVRGENVDEDEGLAAAPALAADAATEGEDEEEDNTALGRARRRDDESRLMSFLFRRYDDWVFPGKPLQVSFGISYQCASYDRSTHVLTSRIYQRISWIDERLVWNASDFGGLETIHVRPWRLWLPDIQLYNEADYEGCKDWINVIILNTGTVLWYPPTKFRSFCQPTGKTSAECQLTIGSWTYTTEYLALAPYKGHPPEADQFDLNQYIEDCPYEVNNVESKITETTFTEVGDPFSTLEVKFSIKARD